MTIFSSTTSFSRGEIDEALYDLRQSEFYLSAAKYMRNWVPDRVGGVFKRPPVRYAYQPGGNAASDGALASIAPVTSTDVSLTRSLLYGSFTSKDLYIQPVTLSGLPFIILVEALSRTPAPNAAQGNAINVSLHAMDPDDPKMLSPLPGNGVTYQEYFENADTDGSFTGGFPYNGAQELTPSLSKLVRIATAGPAAFLVTGRTRVLRLYVDDNGLPHIDVVQFYEELIGQITAERGSTTWTGTDTLFTGQLSNGDTFLFDRETYTVSSVTSDTEFETNEVAVSLSITESGAVARDHPFGTNQYPAQVTFYQNRLVLASTDEKPTGMWLSATNQPFIILPGNVEPDSPINYEIFAPEAGVFKWMLSTDRIYLGGGRSEFAIGQPNVAITPTNFSVIRIGTVGSARVGAAVTGTSFVHVGAKADRLFAVQFSLSRQAFQSTDITFLAPHLFDHDVVSVTYRPATHLDPTPRLFVRLTNGDAITAAYDPDQNLLAWSRLGFTTGGHLIGVNASELAVYFTFRDEQNDCYYITYYDGDYKADLFGDVPLVALVKSGGNIQVEQPYYNKTIAIVVEDGRTYRFAGFATADSNGDASLSGLGGITPGTVVNYMFGYDAELRMLPVSAADARGPMLNRKRRLVRTLVDVLDTWQLYLDHDPMIPPVAKPSDTVTGVYAQRMLGWTYTDELSFRAPYTFKARLRSVTREVSI